MKKVRIKNNSSTTDRPLPQQRRATDPDVPQAHHAAVSPHIRKTRQQV